MTGIDASDSPDLIRMDNQGLERLKKLEELNSKPTWVNSDIYRLMFREDLYILAYERLKSNPGNMTRGSDDTTLDGFSLGSIRSVIAEMRSGTFAFSPGRRIHIPKPNGKTRPLTIASPREKIVQEVMRLILSAIFDSPVKSSFLNVSHGFRAGKGTHTALKEIRRWKNISWFVEGDIRGCFDNIDHHVLMGLVSKRIADQRFLDLIWKALKAGYMEFKTVNSSLSGTPQGSIISPLLANVYLHELDQFVADLRAKHEKGHSRKRNPTYRSMASKLEYWKRKGDLAKAAEYGRQLRTIPSSIVNDPAYIRIHYVRYADDWLIGITGPKALAEELRATIGSFMLNELKLDLSLEKTHIRHARTDEAFFLGTRVKTQGTDSPLVVSVSRGDQQFRQRYTGSAVTMLAPVDRIIKKLCDRGYCDHLGDPTHRSDLINLDVADILDRYNGILLGICNYYSFVDNYSQLNRIQSILQRSAAKTLASKLRMRSMRAIFRKFGSSIKYQWTTAEGKTREASLRLTTQWKRDPSRFHANVNPTGGLYEYFGRKITKSKLGSVCVICGSPDNVEMHHVRHIRKANQVLKGFHRQMALINRKQVPVCQTHHVEIHNGRYDGIGLADLIKRNGVGV